MRTASRVTHRAGLAVAFVARRDERRRSDQPRRRRRRARRARRRLRRSASSELRVGRLRGALRADGSAASRSGSTQRAAAWRRWSAGNDARLGLPARAGAGRGLAAVPRRVRARRQAGARSRGAAGRALPEGRRRNAFDQARAIMDEGARYNIGNVSRNINMPTLRAAVSAPSAIASASRSSWEARRLRSGHR